MPDAPPLFGLRPRPEEGDYRRSLREGGRCQRASTSNDLISDQLPVASITSRPSTGFSFDSCTNRSCASASGSSCWNATATTSPAPPEGYVPTLIANAASGDPGMDACQPPAPVRMPQDFSAADLARASCRWALPVNAAGDARSAGARSSSTAKRGAAAPRYRPGRGQAEQPRQQHTERTQLPDGLAGCMAIRPLLKAAAQIFPPGAASFPGEKTGGQRDEGNQRNRGIRPGRRILESKPAG